MLLHDSFRCKEGKVSPVLRDLAEAVNEDYLRFVVETISIPRHFVAEPENNRFVGDWIAAGFRKMGYCVARTCSCDNIVAESDALKKSGGERVLIGAHYDSVPGTPGADDNASAVAVAMACARVLAGSPFKDRLMFVSFNREEDNLRGSTEFVEQFLREKPYRIKVAHILEMVGYFSSAKGSQTIPERLPIRTPECGDFLALLTNRTSNRLLRPALRQARSYLPDFHVLGLEIFLGMEYLVPHLLRSDHAPFWRAGVPAMMWTDTSEFRNYHYHDESDTPDTLDYPMMKKVAQLLLLTSLQDSV